MRLLELRGNADSRRTAVLHDAERSPASSRRALQRPAAGTESPKDARVFPINSRPPEKALYRRSIDLEQLQRRIELLERRIQERIRKPAEATAPANRELEQLRQRMKLLERRIEGELWLARQREHTLLEMLARPPLKTLIKQHCLQFMHTAPRTTLRWLYTAGQAWWRDAQPLWWPRFAAAWEEALTRARR